MKELRGKTAVITGAGSGIGKALSSGLSRLGVRLALADIDGNGLAQTQNEIKGYGTDSIICKLDVADRMAFEHFAVKTIAHFGAVDILINNAGVSLSGTVYDLTYENFNWIMNINFWGTVYGTKAFLPHLFSRPEANIVNLSSVFGLLGIPGQAAYCASKFAVRGFTESLRVEIQHSKVKVSIVFPGGVKTNIAQNSRSDSGYNTPEKLAEFEKSLVTSAETAAGMIIEGIKNNSPRILIGNDASDIDQLARLKPDDYDAVIWKEMVGE